MGIVGSALFALLTIGAPIGVALAGSAILMILYDPILSPNAVFRAFFSFLGSYTLMAIPFFILAGFLMERTGLIDKLFQFADAIIGWVPGGFAYATLIAAVLFGAISGSSTAMAAVSRDDGEALRCTGRPPASRHSEIVAVRVAPRRTTAQDK